MAANVVTPTAPVAAPAAAAPAASTPAATPPAGGGTPAGGAPSSASGAGAKPAIQQIKDVLTERLKNPVKADGQPTADEYALLTEPAKPFQEFESPDQELPLTGDAATDNREETQPEARADGTEQQAAHPDEELFSDQPYKTAETLAPKDLASALDAKPELKAALDADPQLKSKIFANARRSEKLAQMEQYVRSPEEAKVLMETTGAFNNLSDLMGSVERGNLQSVGNFLTALIDQTILRDEAGSPLLDSKGRPRTDGSVFRLASGLYELRHANLRPMYEAEGNDEAVAAIDTLNRLQGLGGSPASSDSEEDMSPQLRARADKVAAGEKALAERQQAIRADAEKSFKRSVAMGRAEKFDGEVDSLLKASTGLGDFNRDAVATSIKGALKDFLKTDHAYQREVKALEAKPQTDTTRNKLVEVAVRYMRNNLGRLAAPILAEAGANAMTQQATQQANHDARAQASRGDGGTRATQGPTPPANLEGRALNEHIIADLVKSTGRQPSNAEIIAAAARYRLQAGRSR
jgi:hypothetical protein